MSVVFEPTASSLQHSTLTTGPIEFPLELNVCSLLFILVMYYLAIFEIPYSVFVLNDVIANLGSGGSHSEN